MVIRPPSPTTPSSNGLRPNSTVSIGVHPDGSRQFLSDSVRAEQVYVLGKSGTGKTMFLCNVVAQDLGRGACVVFLDLIGTGVPYLKRLLGSVNLRAMGQERGPHEGLNARFRRNREARFRPITILELDREEFPHRFNPLEPVSWMSTAEQAEAFAAAIERMLGGKLAEMRQLHLNLVALASILIETGGAVVEDMIELCCMGSDSLNLYLRRLNRKRANGRLRVPVRRDLIHQYMTGFFAHSSGRERRELTASTLRALAMLLTDPVAARLLSSPIGNLDLEAVTQHGHCLLANIPPHNLHTQAAISSLLLGRLTALAMRRDSLAVQAGEHPQVHLIIDEFQRVFTEETAAEIAVLRNKGVSLVLAHQSGSQPPFHTSEGRGMLESVRDNCSTSIYLRMGRQDALDLAPGCFEPDGRVVKLRRNEVSVNEGTSTGSTITQSTQHSETHTHSRGTGQTDGDAVGQGKSYSASQAQGTQRTITHGTATSNAISHLTAHTQTDGQSRTKGWQRSSSQGDGGAQSCSDSHTRGHSQGAGSSHSANQSQGLVYALRPKDLGSALTMSGKSQGFSSGMSDSDSRNWASSESETQGTSRVRSWQRGASEGESDSTGRSSSDAQTKSRGFTHTQSQSKSESEGQTQTRTQSESDSTTQTRTKTRSFTATVGASTGTSTGEAESTTAGQSSGRTTREVIEHYSVAEETAIRSYELMSLPNRTAIVLQRGQGPLERAEIRTLDMPTKVVTRIGSLDGLKDLERIIAPAPPCPEPELGLLERLRLTESEFDEEGDR